MKKSKYRLYDKNLHCWIQCTREGFLSVCRERDKIRKKAKKAERCVCPRNKIWYCDGICDECIFQINHDKSIYEPVKKGATLTLEECITEEIDTEVQCVESIDFQEILSRLDELMPEAREIGHLRLQGKTEIEISQILNLPRATIYTRIKAVEKKLAEEFGEF